VNSTNFISQLLLPTTFILFWVLIHIFYLNRCKKGVLTLEVIARGIDIKITIGEKTRINIINQEYELIVEDNGSKDIKKTKQEVKICFLNLYYFVIHIYKGNDTYFWNLNLTSLLIDKV